MSEVLYSRHGMTHTREYVAWHRMLDRCRNPKSRIYRYYGGRGIKVCERWKVFGNFFADMGPKPSRLHTLERIDNDGDYEPGNVRWATRKDQARNRSTNHLITFAGETLCLAEWSERTKLPYCCLKRRLQKGWSVEAALTRPMRGRAHV